MVYLFFCVFFSTLKLCNIERGYVRGCQRGEVTGRAELFHESRCSQEVLWDRRGVDKRETLSSWIFAPPPSLPQSVPQLLAYSSSAREKINKTPERLPEACCNLEQMNASASDFINMNFSSVDWFW